MIIRLGLTGGARVAFSALAAAIVLAAGERSAGAVTITVDASKQTAGNPPFWAASVGTGTAALTLRGDLESHYKIANREAGFQRVRGHGVLSDAMGIYQGPGSYSWTNFDKYLTAITQAGMVPIMELDFMPTKLAKNGSDKDTYNNVTDYKNFIAAVAQHCVDKYTMAVVQQWYWEVWNEPDYTPGFWTGTMSDYYALYDAAVAAVISVIPNAIVGGPSTTQPAPIPAFLAHCKSAGTRVSFVDSHVYPGGGNPGSSADAAGLVNDNNTRVGQITSAGYSTSSVMSFSTEWNSSYSGQGGGTGDNVVSMDNNWNVGLILKGMKMISDKNSGNTPVMSVSSYWVISDVFDESSGPSGSYILGKSNGNLPFGSVFGLMTAQGVRKAAFNAYKMLNYLGPVRLSSAGGTYNDGVDAMATMSSAGDSLQILVYDYYKTLNTTGSDSVTVQVSNLPSALSGKQVFVTQFVVDATHSNPYSVWTSQSKPSSPTESQWQAMKAAQHLALMQPVSTMTLSSSYSTTFTINRQAGTLLILSTKRPVTGRNGLVTIEAEDWDGRSSETSPAKEDSADSDLGQSISGASGDSVFYDVVDFSDGGVGSVQMRVKATSATNLEFHADSATGTLLGKCAVSAATSWATQSCTLTPISGVHTLYVVFDGAVHLNWLLFQSAGSSTTGTGGTSGGSGGTTGAGGSGSGAGGNSGSGGSASGGASGKGGATGSGGSASGGSTGSGGSGSGGSSASGGSSGSGGSMVSGSGGSSSPGSGGSASGGDSGNGGSGYGGSGTGSGGNGSGGTSQASGGGGCACGVADTRGPSGTMLITVLVGAAIGLRRPRARRR